MDFSKLILGLLSIVIGFPVFRRVLNKHRRIDTESVAVVKEVRDLGRQDGHKMYAVRYTVQSSEPFDIIATPCKKALPIGKEKVIYYEKDDEKRGTPEANYYFKSIKQFDKRFVMPCFLLGCGVFLIIASFLSIFWK